MYKLGNEPSEHKMNTSTQNSIGKIFIQYIIALTLFIGFVSVAKAEMGMAKHDITQSSDVAKSNADQHMYAKYQAANKNHSHDAWPLVSLNVQDGNMLIKMGSRYRK